MKRRVQNRLSHPFVLFVYLTGAMLITMFTLHPLLLGISFCLASLEAHVLWGRAVVKRLLVTLFPVMLFMVVILPLFSHRGETPLFYINGLAVTKESVCYGFAVTLLFAAIFQWFQIANVLLDSEKLLYLFGRFFPSVGLLVSMVFRMIPLLGERFCMIRDAQRGMGRKQEQLSLRGKISLLLKEVSILVSWSLESSMEMAVSMENRGYGIGKPTIFSLFTFGKKEFFSLLCFLIFYGICLGNIFCGNYVATYFPAVHMLPVTGWGIGGILFFVAGVVMPWL
jgi:energy-coupling factor transport system permease protein